MKTLFKNCYVLCGHEIKFTNLIVDGEIISYIGDKPKEYDTFKDMGGALLIPGLVNAHAHGAMTLLRGVGSGLALQDWLNNAIFPIEAKLTPDDVYIGEKWAIIEMLASGTTLAAEMYDFPHSTEKALLESGMKGTVCRVGLSFSETEEIPPNRFNECVEIVKSVKDATGKVRGDFCLHSEYLTNENFVKQIAKANKELKAFNHIHVSETKKEHEECKARHKGLSPIEYFKELGILDNPTYNAHCVWCTDDDFKIMAANNASLVHNPSSNMKLGSGFARIKRAKELGVNIALGTDGVASNNNLNMFEEMHLASIIHNGFNQDPQNIYPVDVIDMATINGAKALGYLDTGILEVGKKADICALSLNAAHLHPILDLLPLITYSMQASDVIMTMVDGMILYEKGEYMTLDVDKARSEITEVVKRLY